jgi:ribosomal protein S18 acetylase RimI-like enzyme
MSEPARTAFSIRPARPEDYEAIQPLADQMDSLHRERLPDRFRKHDGPPRSREYIESLLRDENTFLAVAESGDGLVGIINTGLTRTPDVPVKVRRVFAKVRGVVVLPEMRRRRIGTALMRKMWDWASSRGAVEVQLNVYDYNPDAMEFFRALGFAPLSHRLYRPLETEGKNDS